MIVCTDCMDSQHLYLGTIDWIWRRLAESWTSRESRGGSFCTTVPGLDKAAHLQHRSESRSTNYTGVSRHNAPASLSYTDALNH